MRRASSLGAGVFCLLAIAQPLPVSAARQTPAPTAHATAQTERANTAASNVSLKANRRNMPSNYGAALCLGTVHALKQTFAPDGSAGLKQYLSARGWVGPWSSTLNLRVANIITAEQPALDAASIAYDTAPWRFVAGALQLSFGQRLTFAHGHPTGAYGPAAAPSTAGWHLANRQPPAPLWGVALGWGALTPQTRGWRTMLFAARTPMMQKRPSAAKILGAWADGDWLDARSLIGMEAAFAWNSYTQLGALAIVNGIGDVVTGLHAGIGSDRISAASELSLSHFGAWAANVQAQFISGDRIVARIDAHHISPGYENVHSRPRGVPLRRGRGPPAGQGGRLHLALKGGPNTLLSTTAQLDHGIGRPKQGTAPWKLRVEEHLTQALGAGFVLRGGGRLSSRPRGWQSRVTAGVSLERPRWAVGVRAAMDWGESARGWRDVGACVRMFERARWSAHAQGGVRHAAKGAVEPFAFALVRARVWEGWCVTARYGLQRAVHTVGGHVEVTL